MGATIPRSRHGFDGTGRNFWVWNINLIIYIFHFIRNYVKFMRARGLEICAWTVNDELEMVNILNFRIHQLILPQKFRHGWHKSWKSPFWLMSPTLLMPWLNNSQWKWIQTIAIKMCRNELIFKGQCFLFFNWYI